MKVADLQNPSEKKKIIAAAVLGLVAIVFLWWAVFGFGGSAKTPPRVTANAPATRPTNTAGVTSASQNDSTTLKPEELVDLLPVVYERPGLNVPEAKRNIFSYYEPPGPAQLAASTPTPTPTPTPPVLLASVSPSNVYARTSDFTLDVSGDKFSPDLRIYVDGRELSTKYRSPQQLSTVVPAAMIANPGVRPIVVRSPDGKVYSNDASLNVAAPPTPNYTYVGIIGTHQHVDTAMLQDKNNKEVVNVQRGDVLGGRFRVTSISEKELVVVDTSLKIKHTLPMTEGERGPASIMRPTPRPETDDDEPDR
ncbi:MAG: TIG domain-containing protein [Pyrinomonadaceae bacterium]